MKNIAKYGEIALRAVAGLIFILAGFGKLTGLQGTTGFFGSLGIPAPAAAALFVGFVELAGGILLLVGLWTYIASSLLAIDILVAIVLVHIPNGWAGANGVRFPLLLLVVLLYFIGTPGSCNLEEKLMKK